MRAFILGSLMASIVWVFLSLDGGNKAREIWDNFHESRRASATQDLAKERESAFVEQFRPARRCLAPPGELKKLECQNRQAMARESFYAEWNRANAKRFPK
jgi:hypothetical protein